MKNKRNMKKEILEIYNGVQELKINESDLNEYYKSSSKRTKIRLYKRYIVDMKMNSALRNEFTYKFNDLILKDKKKGIYKFIASDASEDLKYFLEQFSVVLEIK